MGRHSGTVNPAPFQEISECSLEKRESQTVISDLDGTLVRGRSSFPYFMLIAFEAGSWLRSVILLLLAPIVWVLYNFVSESAGIKVLIFLTFAGLKMRRIETVCRAVLPKFYAEDIHKVSWQVFSSFSKRYILTANPRVMVEVFGKEFLGADEILGSEMQVTKGGYCTGFVKSPGILVGENKLNSMIETFGDNVPDVGMGDRETDWPFMALCKVRNCYFLALS
jgi:glycerol-3-phosphate acyltransferase